MVGLEKYVKRAVRYSSSFSRQGIMQELSLIFLQAFLEYPVEATGLSPLVFSSVGSLEVWWACGVFTSRTELRDKRSLWSEGVEPPF
jgi:hypothetical protein